MDLDPISAMRQVLGALGRFSTKPIQFSFQRIRLIAEEVYRSCCGLIGNLIASNPADPWVSPHELNQTATDLPTEVF